MEFSKLILLCAFFPATVLASGTSNVASDFAVGELNARRLLPDACDMCKLRWDDDDLGRRARMAVNCGQFDRTTPGIESSAGPGYIYTEIVGVPTISTEEEAFTAAVNDWYAQAGTRVYYQLLYAEACYVGCEVMQCGGGPNRNYKVQCFFNEDVGLSTTPFTPGDACTCCPVSRPNCMGDLCYGDEMMVGGDPHFSVRLSTGQLFCFNIRGEAGFNFNLISTTDLEMNAFFIELAKHHRNTRLGAIGMVIGGTEMIFNGTSMNVSIAGNIAVGPDRIGKIAVDKDHQVSVTLTKKRSNDRIKVHIAQHSITFTVVFIHEHLDMFWSSHRVETQHIHGLLGQFLHPEVKIDEKKKLLHLPGRQPVPIKQKTIFSFARSEDPKDYKHSQCWTPVQRSNQGVGIIEGVYTDYEVDSILSTGFKFEGNGNSN